MWSKHEDFECARTHGVAVVTSRPVSLRRVAMCTKNVWRFVEEKKPSNWRRFDSGSKMRARRRLFSIRAASTLLDPRLPLTFVWMKTQDVLYLKMKNVLHAGVSAAPARAFYSPDGVFFFFLASGTWIKKRTRIRLISRFIFGRLFPLFIFWDWAAAGNGEASQGKLL